MNMQNSRGQTLKDVIKSFEDRMKDSVVSDEEYRVWLEKEETRRINEKVANVVPRMYLNSKLDKSIPIDPSKSFYLHGEPGRGKTHYVYAYMIECINKGVGEPVVIYFPEICSRYKNASFKDKESIILELQTKRKLIVDDVAGEIKSDMSLELLSNMVNYRYENMLYLSFTSNLSIGKLPYDDARIKSRIAGIVKDNKHTLITKKDKRL